MNVIEKYKNSQDSDSCLNCTVTQKLFWIYFSFSYFPVGCYFQEKEFSYTLRTLHAWKIKTLQANRMSCVMMQWHLLFTCSTLNRAVSAPTVSKGMRQKTLQRSFFTPNCKTSRISHIVGDLKEKLVTHHLIKQYNKVFQMMLYIFNSSAVIHTETQK